MPLLRVGRDLVALMLVGQHSTAGAERYYDSTGARIWVGTGSAAHSAADTFIAGTTISGSTMEAGYPIVRSCNVLEFRILKSTNDAVWSWMNWGVNNASVSSTASGRMLNRMVEDLGAKTCSQAFQLTACMTLTT